MSFKYYLKNEYKTKWGLIWRECLLALVAILLLVIPFGMFGSGNGLLMLIALPLFMIIEIGVLIYGLKIIMNIIMPKYVPGLNVSFKQMSKKALGLLVFAILLGLSIYFILLVITLLFLLIISKLTIIIGFIVYIALMIVMMTLNLIFYFAIIETISEGDFSFKSSFVSFWKNKTVMFKSVLKLVLKLIGIYLLMLLIMGVAYILYVILLIVIISLAANEVLGVVLIMIMTICFLIGVIFYYAVVYTAMIQYIFDYYFTKVTKIEQFNEVKVDETNKELNENQIQ